MSDSRIQELLARYIHQRLTHGGSPDPARLCRDCPELIESLRACIQEYERVDETLECGVVESTDPDASRDLPVFDGFRTIERLGGGGGGEVYKLEDLELGRTVAAKVIRPDNPLRANLADFLREARTLALFDDPRVVKLFEFRRAPGSPPVLLMEYVEGFELDRLGSSLEFPQRARVMFEIAEAIDRGHRLGIQHRDLKPANIMLDARLVPRILDFGLSRGDSDRGHGVGTPAYMAPEQLDRDRPIDERSDVYALGIILYQLLCGVTPYEARSHEECVAAIRRGKPKLPVETEPDVPEPLQAIALKAMERDPADRYASAKEMALDLRRYLEDQPVLARPSLYHTALERRVRPHLEQIREWLRIKLIYPHEAQQLRDAYGKLEARDDDWIVHGRALSFSQIALYLGAFLLLAGSLIYFQSYFLGAIEGLAGPFLVLGLPIAGLEFAARRLDRRQRKAVAVAFHLAAVLLLPMLLVIVFEELGWWTVDPGHERELFGEGFMSNRQLQVALLIATCGAALLAVTTRTLTLSACFTGLLFLFNAALLGDFGLRSWLEQEQWHLLAIYLAPLLVVTAALAGGSEKREQPWLARPLYLSAALLFVAVLELLALNGKLFELFGITLAPFQGLQISNPRLLDTVAAMTLNGVLIYIVGGMLEQRGTRMMRSMAWMLYVISPFAILQPLSHLVGTGEYSRRYDWLYLALSLAITLLSHYRQRRSFYYAGLLNTGAALWFITDHHDWFERPAWATTVVVTGLVVLAVGLTLHVRESRLRLR